MLIGEVIRTAFASLRSNALRSLLTMLGIIIGVAAVIAMIALGNGAAGAVKDRIARLGTTTLQINPQRVMQGGIGTTATAKLTYDDVKSIEAHALSVVGVTPQQDRNLQVVWKSKNTNVQVTGTTPNFLDVRGFALGEGAMFTSADNQGRQRVAVLGADVLPLLDVTDPQAVIGETIRISGRQFKVIGVLARKGTTGFGDNDEQILIPFLTGRFGIFGTDRINDIWARVVAPESVTVAMGEIQSALRRSHRLTANRPDDFTIRNQADLLSTLSETTATFTTLLAGIAAVSLLVGGIGIMNIMLVSVTERTREIGIRKALGATRRNILLQFLVEAVVLVHRRRPVRHRARRGRVECAVAVVRVADVDRRRRPRHRLRVRRRRRNDLRRVARPPRGRPRPDRSAALRVALTLPTDADAWSLALHRDDLRLVRAPLSRPHGEFEPRDARRHPHRARGESRDHVAQVVDAEVQPGPADEEHERDGRDHHDGTVPVRRRPQLEQHIRKHRKADERPHGVAARIAERNAVEKAFGADRPRASNHVLEHPVEKGARRRTPRATPRA